MLKGRSYLERTRVESALRLERDRAQRYLDTAEVILLALDLDGRITLINRKGCDLLGWTEGELLGRDFLETCLPARTRVALREKFHAVVGGDLSVVEAPVLTRSGEERLVEWHNTLLRDDGGHVIGTFSSGSDVTERKRAEEEIRDGAQRSARAERDFRTLFAANPLPMWIYDLTTLQFLEVNDAAVQRYGYERDEFLAMTIKDIRSPEDVAGLLAHVAQPRMALQDAGSWRHRAKSGEIIDVEITSHTIAFAGQSAALVVAQDITERRRAAAALAQSEARKASVLDSVLDCIITMDADGNVIEFNAAAERTFGYTKAEAIGRALGDLIIPPPLRDAHTAGLARYLSTGEGSLIGKLIEITAVRSDGSEVPVELTITAIRSGKAPIFTGVLRDLTARKQADETGARLAAIVDSSDDAIFSMALDDTILTWNAGAERLYGYTASEIIGRSRALLVPPGKRAELTAFLEKAAHGETVQSFETQRRRKDGSIFDISLTSSPVRDPSGRVTGTSAIARDITERKRAEEEIRHGALRSALGAAIGLSLTTSESLARALQQCAEALVTHLEAALAHIWTLNERDGELELQARAGLYTHLDGPQGKVPLGQFEIGRIAQDLKPYLTNSVIGDPQVIDQDWARREGIVAFASHPLIVHGRVVGVMAIFARHALSEAVISALASVADHIALGIERHRSAEALRTAEERMRFALQSANVGIWDMDYTTGVLRWSEILEAQHGLEPGTFGGTFEAFVERIHPDDRESVLETVGKAMKAGADYSVQNRTIWPDGTVRWLSGMGRVLLGENGEPVRGIGISLDVTERRTLEAQYQQAQKMEAVGRLAGGVAHDFNNLLTAILGYCEMLLSDLDADDPRQSDIAEIHKAGVSAAALTRQLLDFSRKQIIKPTLLDLNVVVTDMQALLGRLIEEDVHVVLALQSELTPVMADRGQLEQIVVNLAVNARDAMPGGGTVRIETANVELDEHYAATHLSVKPGSYVALTVTDTGIGMTPEVQARIFEPFFTLKGPGKGTGLGLATVHGIVMRSGGSIQVYSEVGKGTSLTVYIPKADAGEMAVEAASPVSRPHAGAQTVLVVDDAEGLRELTRRMLQRLGYQVLVAANGHEALELFDRHASIDVLVTDVVMPGASGPELAKRLVERRPALKVIYMSGYTEDTIVHHGVLDPGIAFLHKPYTAKTLGRKIQEVLDR